MKANQYALAVTFEVEKGGEVEVKEVELNVEADTLREAMETAKADANRNVTPLYVTTVSRNGGRARHVGATF